VATPVSRFLVLLGTMRLPTRNAEGIRALVSLLAPNTRAIITEPDPVKVHIDNRSGLGAGNRIRLSQRATLGKTAKEACSRILVTLETEDPVEAEGWLPGGLLHTDLLVLLRVYLGYGTTASYIRKVKRTMAAGANDLPIASLKQMAMITQYYDRTLSFSSDVNYRVETADGEQLLSGSGTNGYIDKSDSESEYWVFLS